MMTGRCLRPQAGVYNYAQHCRQRGQEGCRASVLSELSSQHRSVCPARNFCSESPGAKLEALRGNFTLPRRLHSHFRSPKVSDRDWDTSHTRKYTNTYTYTYTRIHGCEGPLQQALIKSCSWALLLLSPCDWCLASLAVTNTD